MNVATREVLVVECSSKLYDRVLIRKVRAETECAIGEEQCGFWQGRGYMDQVLPSSRLVKSI